MDPNVPVGDIKAAWESAKAGVQSRFHDLRHTACTRLLERGASLSVVASIMGWSASTTAKMAKRYGHIGSEVQRTALDTLVQPPRRVGGKEDQAKTDSAPHS
jgi:site-specific recombinase XerD